MVMETLQIRLPKAVVEQLDMLVKRGVYSSRSDALREIARRQLFWESQIGTIKLKGDSVSLIRKAREELSKLPVDLDEINSL